MKLYSGLCLLLIILTGCASTSSLQKDMKDVEAGKKALVFGYCFMKLEGEPCMTTWRDDKNETNFISNSGPRILEPGTYSLRGFWSDASEKGFKYSISNLRNIASFSVKGGEVLYIGHLEFDLNKKSSIHRAINVLDDKNSLAVHYLTKNQPELLPHLQTRLIQLSPETLAAQSSRNSH